MSVSALARIPTTAPVAEPRAASTVDTARLRKPDTAVRIRPPPSPTSQRLERALTAVLAYSETPSDANRGELMHALDVLNRLKPSEHPGAGDLFAVRDLRRAIHTLAKSPQDWDLAWKGSVVARFAEIYRNEPSPDAESQRRYASATGVRWKEFSDSYFGASQARAVYDVLQAAGVFPPSDQPLRFISAAANAATHEAAICERDAEIAPDRKGGRQFIVGDIADVPKRAMPGPSFGTGFLHVRWDANKLPLAPNSIDVIWDRKGRTWFALMHDFTNATETAASRSPLMALSVLQHYEEILKPGGSVVLDAIPDFDRVQRITAGNDNVLATWTHLQQTGALPADIVPQAERSTVDAMNLIAQHSGIDVQGLIASRFSARFVGEGVTRCLVLTKR